jgi:hypothetical protein
MPVIAVAEELMRRVHSFVLRVMNDPALIQKKQGEFQSAVEAWKMLQNMLPGVIKISAEEFQKALTEQAQASNHERAAIASEVLKKPKVPGPNATEVEMAQYQRELGKYNRMFEMYSKIMANAHEMKKSLISNFPR